MNNVIPPSDVDLPDGVDILAQEPFVPDAEGNNSYRLVWSMPATVPDRLSDLDARLVAIQLADGSFVTDNTGDHEPPTIYVGGDNYSVADARIVSNALADLADLADQWTGQSRDRNCALASARRAVLVAYTTLSREPGNAGEYLRAALDSITDAEAVLR